MDTVHTPLSDLAVRHPSASRVFHKHRLDYCCGGHRSLQDACLDRNVDPEGVLHEIFETRATSPHQDWTSSPLSALIAHILEVFHRPLPEELSELRAMASKVERVHAEKTACPRGLADHLDQMVRAISDHMRKEEELLFPSIVRGLGGRTSTSVSALEDEHRDLGRDLEKTRELTANLTPPAEACTTWRALYVRLQELEQNLMDHIHLENNVLFPRALREGASS